MERSGKQRRGIGQREHSGCEKCQKKTIENEDGFLYNDVRFKRYNLLIGYQ